MSFSEILFAIPIAISFCVLIFKLVDILYKDEQCKDRYQKTATTLFIFGLVGIIISHAIFNNNNELNNRAVRFGLLGGGSLIIFYSVVKNWDLLDDITKLLIFGISFVVVIGWSYFASKNIKKLKNKKKINKKNDDDYYDDLDDDLDNEVEIKKPKKKNQNMVNFKMDDDDDDDDLDL